ncbi:MAG: hypothetical protein RL072_1489 [Actinomycetota bacterium]|jgi:hypothetical protein
MTIERGQPWGTEGTAPHDLVLAAHEEAAARAVSNGARHVALRDGDLLAALGTGLHDRTLHVGAPCRMLPCDAYDVTLTRRGVAVTTIAVSKVLVGDWRRPVWWFTSGGFVGGLNVSPTSHPNDGRADVLEWSRVSLRELLAIRRRMRLGDHLPHPALHVARGHLVLWKSPSGTRPVTIDGRNWGHADGVTVTVRNDAFVLCVPN